MRSRRGSSFYLDRNPREVATYCGAPVTALDISAADMQRAVQIGWLPPHGIGLCPDCIREVNR